MSIVGSVTWQNVLGVLGNCGLFDDLNNLLGSRDSFLDDFLNGFRDGLLCLNNNFNWICKKGFKTIANANVILLGDLDSFGDWERLCWSFDFYKSCSSFDSTFVNRLKYWRLLFYNRNKLTLRNDGLGKVGGCNAEPKTV